jgi:hypothetical protein
LVIPLAAFSGKPCHISRHVVVRLSYQREKVVWQSVPHFAVHRGLREVFARSFEHPCCFEREVSIDDEIS